METRSGQGMHRIGKDSEAPELENFFASLTKNSALNYCVVCLRTEKERRLSKCKLFKEFSNVTKIQNNWQNHLICFICEHQAANALQFYKKAVFASRIHQILLEYLYQKACVRKQLFKQQVFKEILCKLGMAKSGDKTSPSEFEEELLQVRGTSQLNETKTLVIDNNEGKKISDIPASSIEIDDGEVTATAVRSSKTGQSESTGPGRPTRKQDSLNKLDKFKLKTDKLMASKTTNDSLELSSPQPKVSEALVILEDDEGSRDEEPYPIRIDKVVSNATFNPPPPGPPKLVPIENLLEKRNEDPFPVRLEKVVSNTFDPPSLVPAPKLVTIQNLIEKSNEAQTDNIVLHPIVLSGGMLTVPTLSANILNGQLVYRQIDPNHSQNLNGPLVFQNGVQTSSSILSTQTNTGPMLSVSPLVENVPTNPLAGNQILSKILPKSNTTTSVFPNTKVATKILPQQHNNAPNQVFSMKDVFNDNKLKTEVIKNDKTNPQKVVDKSTNKRESDELATPNKKPKELRAATDWEDKIPMDVISFMDAVDPNPTIIPENSGLSQVQINRPQTIETGAEVIDLS